MCCGRTDVPQGGSNQVLSQSPARLSPSSISLSSSLWPGDGKDTASVWKAGRLPQKGGTVSLAALRHFPTGRAWGQGGAAEGSQPLLWSSRAERLGLSRSLLPSLCLLLSELHSHDAQDGAWQNGRSTPGDPLVLSSWLLTCAPG